VSSGNALFTLIGFMGLYVMVSALYFFLMTRIIAHGPESDSTGHEFEPIAGGPESVGA
jgi:cytochrome bd-type quinol oxidase subunit 1